MNKAIGIIGIVGIILGMAMTTLATEPRVEIKAAGQEQINISNDSRQQVVRSYVLGGARADERGWHCAQLINMLKSDGAHGARVTSGILSIDGKRQFVVLTVSATPDMQKSIQQLGYTTYTYEQIDQYYRGLGYTPLYRPTPGIYKEFYHPQNRSAEFLASKIGPGLSPVGSISHDTEMVVFADNPTDMAWIKHDLGRYDVPLQERVIEVTVLEARSSFRKNVGVYWGAFKDAAPAGMDIYLTNDPWLKPRSIDSVNIFLSNLNPKALFSFLNFVVEDGGMNVKSTTVLTLTNLKKGVFNPGTVHRYTTSLDGDNYVEREIYEGFYLEANAKIMRYNTILDITTNYTSILSWGQANRPQPKFNRSELTTSLQLSGSEPHFLGGLEARESTTADIGAPGVKKFKFFGKIAHRETKESEKRDLFIVVRMRNAREAMQHQNKPAAPIDHAAPVVKPPKAKPAPATKYPVKSKTKTKSHWLPWKREKGNK